MDKTGQIFRAIGSSIAITMISLASCNPIKVPGGNRLVRQEEERITRVTEDAIKKSSVLQDLDQLCGKRIPHPHDFVFASKSMATVSGTYLTFYYESGTDYPMVKKFYSDYFISNGWLLGYQKDGGWGQRQADFTKERYEVKLFDVGGGQYAVQCGRLIGEGP